MIMMLAIVLFVFALGGFLLAYEQVKVEKQLDEATKLLERNKETRRIIEHTQAELSLREGEIRKKEEELKNRNKYAGHRIDYAVSQSDYIKFSTPSKIKRYVRERMAKQILLDIDFDKHIFETVNRKGDKLYTFTYFLEEPTTDNR